MRKISFIIPCYNSEKTIEKVVKGIKEIVRENDCYEIILVNDCSKDGVWNKIKEMANQEENIKGVSFAKNFGQHAALMAGYRHATGDIIVSLDDDGQTPVEEVYSLIDTLEEGYDVVYASYANKKHSLARNLGTKLNNFMCEKLLKKPKDLMITSYFVSRRFIIQEIIKYDNPYTYVPGLVLRTTNNIGTVPVNHKEREIGVSGYNFKKLVALWVNGFTAFSVVPLRISMFIGIASSCIGFLYLIYVLINKAINPLVPLGWSSTISILLLLGGLILFVLGMIGEYIGRIYISINKSPQYVEKETIHIRGKEK